jgi:hypothetical protein
MTRNSTLAGAHSFYHLCRLTQILGSILPLIYSLKIRSLAGIQKLLRPIEIQLDEWEDSVPRWLRYGNDHFQRSLPGALNLNLCFLAVKMCISRLLLLVCLSIHCFNSKDQQI